jgi:hypothetical protein
VKPILTSSSQRIGIVTCGAEKLADYFPTAAEPDFVPTEPRFTPDDQRLVDELRRRGHDVLALVWGAETTRLAERFDVLIIRSPWDYMDSDEQRHGFLRWLEQLAATGVVVEYGQIMVHAERGGSLRFADPPAVVRELGDRAAAAVPRAFAHRGGRTCRMPLYLRIDVIKTATGAELSECEGVEPERFFRAQLGSEARFAECIQSRLTSEVMTVS